MRLRTVEMHDMDAIEAIEKASFSVPWSVENLVSEGMLLPYATMLVAEENDVPFGYVCLRFFPPEAEITNIAVDPARRRQGIGEMLIDAALEYARGRCCDTVGLEVRESNLPAIALYEKKGFARVGLRKNYYEQPTENALLLNCTLS